MARNGRNPDDVRGQFRSTGTVLAGLGVLGLVIGAASRLLAFDLAMAEAESFAATGAVLLVVGMLTRSAGGEE